MIIAPACMHALQSMQVAHMTNRQEQRTLSLEISRDAFIGDVVRKGCSHIQASSAL